MALPDALARYPIRRNVKFLEWLSGIVRFERNLEQVLAIHPFVHHNVHIDRGGLTGL